MGINKDILIDINDEVVRLGGNTKSDTYAYNKDVLLDILENVKSISGDVGFKVEIVTVLPDTGDSTTIYLIANGGSQSNVYDEYMYIDDEWEKIGSTEVDLTNYYNKTETDNLLDDKQDEIDSSHKLNADLVDDTSSTNKFVTSAEKTTWNGKQDTLTFDSTPTENSNNPVTSNGIFQALAGAGGGGLPVNVITTYPMPSSFDMANADVGIYQFEYQNTSSNIKYDVRSGYNIFKAYSDYIHEICVLKKVDWTTPPTQTEVWGYVTKWSNSAARLERYYCYRQANNTNGYTLTLLLSDSCLLTYNNATINAIYTFNSLPVSSYTPTRTNQFTTKSYVDNLIAPAYSTSSTYDVDDLVIYSSKLYKCNTAITTAEEWDSAKWTETTLAEVLKGA